MDITEIFGQVGVGVRLGIGEVNLIVITVESVSESEGVVASLEVCLLRLILSVVVRIVREVLTTSVPSFLALFLLLG